ncbi:MAG: hypothetical protein AB8U44_00990, partial [Aaplasma endosymbiont of Hyalomma asiaticum]
DTFTEMFDEEKAAARAAEEREDDFSDTFTEMFDEEKAAARAAEEREDDFSDTFTEMFDEEKAAARAAEEREDDFSDTFTEMFDEEKAAARAAEEREDDFSDTFTEMFDEEKAAARAAEEREDDFSDSFAEMFDEEKAAARAAEEREDDFSDSFAEMFDEEKAAARAAEEEKSEGDNELSSIFASVLSGEKTFGEESALGAEDSIDDDGESLGYHGTGTGFVGVNKQEALQVSPDGNMPTTSQVHDEHAGEAASAVGKSTEKFDAFATKRGGKDSSKDTKDDEKDRKQEGKGGVYAMKKKSATLTKEETKLLEKTFLGKLMGVASKSADKSSRDSKEARSANAKFVDVVKGLGGITKAAVKQYISSNKKGVVEHVADRAEIDNNNKNKKKGSKGGKQQTVESSEKKLEKARLAEILKLEKELSNLRARKFATGAAGEELKGIERDIEELERKIRALNCSGG